MPRKPRIEYENAIYHVMCRGNQRCAIFLDDGDREIFLDTLDEACVRTGWRVFAFVLMGNHYHLLFQTPEANLVAGMKWFQGTYTQRFHARNRTCGHLFQGRYKALVVQDDPAYFTVVGNYIHLNPARAELFDLEHGKLTDYKWSSYPLYFRPPQRPGWLDVEGVLSSNDAADDRKGREHYRRQMQQQVFKIACGGNPAEVDEQWNTIRRGWSFGTASFRDKLLEKLDGVIGGSGKRESFDGEQTRMHDELEAKRLLEGGLGVLGMTLGQVRGMRFSAPEKCLLAWLLRRHTAVANAWICEKLRMGRVDCFSRYPKRAEQIKDRKALKLKSRLEKITKIRD